MKAENKSGRKPSFWWKALSRSYTGIYLFIYFILVLRITKMHLFTYTTAVSIIMGRDKLEWFCEHKH